MKSVLVVTAVVGLTTLVMPSIAAAQSVFTATLTGGAQVPVISSPGKGTGAVLLNAAEDQITVNMSFSGLTSTANMAHIHGPAAVGVNANILFPFSGLPAATAGTLPEQTFPVSPLQVTQLKAGQFYFNIHTDLNPGGEIRGQILMARKYTATLTGAAQVPPVASPGTGTGILLLNSTEDQITVDTSFTGLTSNANVGHIHGPAPVGETRTFFSRSREFPRPLSGFVPEQTFSITPGQVAQLNAGQFYFNIHTTINPGGESGAKSAPPRC